MSNPTFTPGPWSVSRSGNQLPTIVGPVETPPGDVAKQMNPGEQCHQQVCRMRGAGEATEANARLIAATPDLIAIVEEYVNTEGCGCFLMKIAFPNDNFRCLACRAKDVLAKATGSPE